MPVSNQKILEAVLPDANPQWGNRISQMSKDFWYKAKQQFTESTWEGLKNDLWPMINQMAMDVVVNLETANPLAPFKTGEGFMLGNYIRQSGIDIIKGDQFKGVDNPVDQFEPSQNKPLVQYFGINREYQYRTTIPDFRVTYAFQEEFGLNRLLAEIIASLYKSNTVDEYVLAQAAFVAALQGNNTINPSGANADQYDTIMGSTSTKLLPTQMLQFPDIGKMSATSDDMRNFVYLLRNLMDDMTISAKKKYNAMGRTTCIPRGDLVLVLNYSVYNQNVVQNMSGLYNPEMSAFDIPIVKVDNFGAGGENILGVVCGREFLQIFDNMSVSSTAQQARSLYRNQFLTVVQTYGICHFHPAVYLLKPNTNGAMMPADAGIVPSDA